MSPARMARIESAIRTALAYHEAFNRHDVAGILQLISADCIFETAQPAPDGSVYTGKDAIAQYLQNFFSTSPDVHMEIEEAFGFGERCILRWKQSRLDAAGEKLHIRGADIFREQNGLIREKLSYVKGSEI